MNPWVILNIPENSSLKEIKKAYASLLKAHNPEDDPEGYQRLREAYNKACKIAKKNKNVHSNLIDNNTQLVNTHNKINKENLHDSSLLFDSNLYYSNKFNFNHIKDDDNENEKIDKLEHFKENLSKVYNNLSSRYDPSAWKKLLTINNSIWNINQINQAKDYLIKYLICHVHISKDVWNTINTIFAFDSNLNDIKDNTSLFKLIHAMNYSTKLNYNFISNIDSDNVDMYLEYRLQALIFLDNNDLKMAYLYLDKAMEIYEFDNDLWNLYGEAFLADSKYDLAKDMFKKALEIDYSDEKANFYLNQLNSNSKLNENNDSSTVITYFNKKVNDEEENYYNLSTYKKSLSNLYGNINQRYDIESWNELLNKIPFWDLVTLKAIEEYTIIFLLKNNHISLETWSLIDNYFSLSENSSRYNASNQLIDLIKIMGYSTQLSYNSIKNITLKNVDLYLKHRLNAFILIENNRMYDAIKELNEAKKLCDFDECLFDLYGYTYIQLNKYNLALDMFNKALKINRNDIKAMINLSKLYCSSKNFNIAINYLEPLYNDFNIKTDEILIMTALCYYHLDKYKEAHILFEKLLNIKYVFFKKYINNIDLNLKLKVINHKLKYNFNFFNLANDLKNKNTENLMQKKRNIFKRFSYRSIPKPLVICISLIILSFGFHIFDDNTNTTNNSTYNKNFHDTPNTHIDLHENYSITDIQSVPYYIITKDDKDYLATFDEYNSIKDTVKIKYRVYFGYSNGKGIFFFYHNEVKDNKANVVGICTLYGKKINDELKNYAINNLQLNPNIDCTYILITSYSPND